MPLFERVSPGFSGKLIDVGASGSVFSVDQAGNMTLAGTINSAVLADTFFVTYLQPVGTAAATWLPAGSNPFFTFPNDGRVYKCTAASVRYTTASSSALITVELSLSGTAPGSGTAQFTGVTTSAAANTVLNMTAPVSTASAAGASLNLTLVSGTVTGLVGCVVTVALQRVS